MPRPDRSRAALITAAATLFRRQGLAATSINQILDAASVKVGSLYHHFPDGKNDLAVAVVETVGGAIEQRLLTQLNREVDIADVIDEWLDALAAGLAADHRDGCPIEPLATESIHSDTALRAASARVFASWCEAVAHRLHKNGRPASDAAAIAQSVIALIEGSLILAKTTEEPSALEAAKKGVRRLTSTED